MEDIIIYKEAEHTINTLNGILNEDNLLFAKRTMLFDELRNHTELVKHKQYYPHNDISRIDMTLDLVIMDRQRYDNLTKFSNLFKEQKYLKLPNLEA